MTNRLTRRITSRSNLQRGISSNGPKRKTTGNKGDGNGGRGGGASPGAVAPIERSKPTDQCTRFTRENEGTTHLPSLGSRRRFVDLQAADAVLKEAHPQRQRRSPTVVIAGTADARQNRRCDAVRTMLDTARVNPELVPMRTRETTGFVVSAKERHEERDGSGERSQDVRRETRGGEGECISCSCNQMY